MIKEINTEDCYYAHCIFDNEQDAVEFLIKHSKECIKQHRLIRDFVLEKEFNIDTQIYNWAVLVRGTNIIVYTFPSLGEAQLKE